MMLSLQIQRLLRQIQYEFKNLDLLKQALTHRSIGPLNNERLEFIGDSLLNSIIALELFQRFPEKSEGELSRLRALLVKGDTLAVIAATLNLGDCLILGPGELKSGGFRRASTLADALEALFAAIFLDSDFNTCQSVIVARYTSYFNDPDLLAQMTDSKTKLQEYLQAKKLNLPQYNLLKVEGEEHQQSFQVSCEVPSLNLKTIGQAETRRKAEQQAAHELLNLLIQNR